jgi:adenosylcobinamide-phosphate synthase
VAGALVSALASRLGFAGLLLEAAALTCLLSLRGLVGAARDVAADLSRGDLVAARRAVGYHLVSRPTAELDAGRVASATVESVAENLTDSLVAPALFFLAGGLPGAAVYRVINTADAMFGYRLGPLEFFGKIAARLDDLLNLIPARLAGFSLVVGAALVGEDGRRALACLRRDRRRTASPNAGWTMSAMAGALGVVLEKPGTYRLGAGDLPIAGDVERSLRVLGAAVGVSLLVLVAAYLGGRLLGLST